MANRALDTYDDVTVGGVVPTNSPTGRTTTFGGGNDLTGSSVFRDGTTGAGVRMVNGGTASGYLTQVLTAAVATRVVSRHYFRIDTQTHTTDLRLLACRDAAGNHGVTVINPSLLVGLRTAAGTSISGANSPVALELGQGYFLEMARTPGTDNTNGKLEYCFYKPGDTLSIASAAVPNVDAGTATATQYRIGANGILTGGGTYGWDSFEVQDLATGWIGVAVNQPPVVVPGGAQGNIEPGSLCTSSITATDADGAIVSTVATVNNGAVLAGTGNSRTFVAPPRPVDTVYTVTWTVTDNNSAVTTVTQTFMVLAATLHIAQAAPPNLSAYIRKN